MLEITCAKAISPLIYFQKIQKNIFSLWCAYLDILSLSKNNEKACITGDTIGDKGLIYVDFNDAL